MALAERRATVVWNGNLTQGNGNITLASGAATLPVTWASRTEQSDGKTSPEELIAAAHATCFLMVMASNFNKDGTPSESLTANSTCTLDRIDGQLTITSLDVHVRGRVPGIDAAAFEQAAKTAGESCPVSRALRGNVEIRVQAELEQ